MSKIYTRPLVMASLAIALALGGCQTMSDLDPTGLIGGDDTPAPESQFPPDSQQQATADANTTTPDLANIPARPAQPDTAAQANTTQQVTAAGAQAQYSAEALRAGTDAPAPPPAATDAAATKQALAAAAQPPSAQPPSAEPPSAEPPSAQSSGANDAPPSAGSALAGGEPPTASAAPPTAAAPVAPSRPARAAAEPAVGPQVASAAAAPVASAPLPPPSASQAAAVAPMTPPPGAEPAVPAVPMTRGARMAMANPSDADLGFKPSSAPPLSPSVAQWVAPPILAHYRETAAMAGAAGTATPAVAAVPAVADNKEAGNGRPRRRARDGNLEAGMGDVVANLDAVPGSPVARAAALNGGAPPTAIIYFPGDTTSLSAAARAKVHEAVDAFRAAGGTGTVKVVGHSSSRTADMPVEKHLEVIFQKSQARANAVAQALIKAGIPADRVQIEAVGDSQPIYYESMPKGEDGNRRAEIFVQS